MHTTFFRRRNRLTDRFPAAAGSTLVIVAGLLFVGAVAVFAQEMGGPTPEEIAVFESQFTPPVPEAGGPDESQIERPQFEEPGEISAEVRSQVSEADLVAVYCAMTRWKSGAFFAAMDAVEQLIIPATEGIKSIGVSVDIPDTAALKAEGESRVAAICGASTVDEADRLVRDFMAWGKSVGDGQFAAMRNDMRTKIGAVGDAMRAEIKTELDPYIEEQTAKITAEIESHAQTLVDQKSARFANYTHAPSEAEINTLTAEITNELQGLIYQKKAEIETVIQAKVQELAGARQKKLEDAAGAFTGMEKKMNDAIKAGSAKYDVYREEAIFLRKKMVLDILDRSLEAGLKELDARSADVEEARGSDPSVPSVSEVRSEIARSRQDLETKLEAALRAGDEAAFQSALADFRVKWETFRTGMEKAAQQSASKVCTAAVAQFSQARAKINAELGKLADLENKCRGSSTEECLKVNEFSPRFGTLISSLSDIVLEMAVAEKMCETPETADNAKLTALMKKIQADAEDVKVYGEALAAEKSKVIAASAAEVCAQVLPQLRAGKTEVEKNEMAALEAELAKCQKTKTGLCADQTIPSHIARIKPLMKDFLEGEARAEDLCQSPNEDQFVELRDLLSYLKGTGDKLKWEVATMRSIADSYKKASKKEVCESGLSKLAIAKREMSLGIKEMNALVVGCQGEASGRCAIIARGADKFAALQQKVRQTLAGIAAVETECKTAAVGTEPDDVFIGKINALKDDEAAIKKMEAELRGSADLTWPNHIKTHKPFKVILDVAPGKFDDKPWTGNWRTDQMGTIRGGETYAVTYTSAPSWQATGYNEQTAAKGTWTYKAGDPDKFELDIWGRVYTFDDQGNVYDPDFGLVGHLLK